MADTLLDAFVKVAVDPDSPVSDQLDALFASLQEKFGKVGKNLGKAMTAGIAGGASGGGAGGGGRGGAGGLFRNMREEELKFRRDFAKSAPLVFRLNDADIKNRLNALKSSVREAKAQFERPESTRSEKDAAIQQVQKARQDLLKLRTEAQSFSSSKGQPAVGDSLEQQLRIARDEATGLRNEMQEVGRAVGKVRDGDLSEGFRRAQEESRRLEIAFTKALDQKDLPGVDAALTGLRSLSQQFEKLRSRAGKRLDFDVKLKFQETAFKRELGKVNAELGELATIGSGSLSGANKVQLAKFRKEIELAELAIEKLNAEAAKTKNLLLRLAAAKINLLQLKDGMVGVYQKATVANGSLNNLNNNMYQLGQAIEDFSVGFELNGLKGGIRGAANNVSFLINNMGQALESSNLIGEKWKLIVGLGSGIAGAVGILVIPRLVEWLQSLNDIQSTTKKLTDEMETLADKADFAAESRISGRDFSRSLTGLKDFQSILDTIIEKSEDAESRQLTIFERIRVGNLSEAKQSFNKAILELLDVGRKGLKPLKKVIEDGLDPKNTEVPTGGGMDEFGSTLVPGKLTEKELFLARIAVQDFKNAFVDGIQEMIVADQALSKATADGIVDLPSLNRVKEQIDRIVKSQEKMKATGFISDKDLEKNVEIIEGYKKEVEKTIVDAEELRRIHQELSDKVLGRMQERMSQVSADLKFQEQLSAGRLSEEDEILFTHRQQRIELDRQLKIFREIRTALGTNEETISGIENTARETNRRQQQIEFIKREFDANQDLKKEIEESQFEGSQASSELQFRNDLLSKRREKEEEILFNQQQQTKELEQQLKLLEDASRRSGASQSQIDAAKTAQRRTLALQQQIDLLKRIKELEEQDPGSSRRGSPDDFFVGVDAGDKEQSSLEKELALLREAVNGNREALEGKGAAGVAPGAAAAAAEAQAAADRSLLDSLTAARNKVEKELDTVLARLEKSSERAMSLEGEARTKELERIDKEVRAAEDRRRRALEAIDRGEIPDPKKIRAQQIREEREKRRKEREQEEKDRAGIPGFPRDRAAQREEDRGRAAEEKRKKEEERNQAKQADRDDLNRLNALDDQILDVTAQMDKAFGAERDRLKAILEDLQRQFDQGWQDRQRRRDQQMEEGVIENPWADKDLIRNQTEGARNAAELAKAMKDGLPFTSETIEKLLEASNRTLEAINQGIAKFDTAARVA